MNRQTFNALCAQYATPKVSGDGLVSWDSGKKCVIPSIELYGAAVQDGEPTPENPVMPVCNNGVFAARGRNLLDLPREITSGELGDAPAGGLLMMYLPAGVSITAGRWIRYNAGDDVVNRRLTIRCTYEDDTYVSARTELGLYENDEQWHYESISVTPAKPVKHIQYWLADYSTSNARDYDIRDAQLVIGSYTSATMPPYTPYYDGGQAQAPDLWAIPGTEYRDEWNPQTGRGIRRVRKIVLDGVSDVPKFYEALGAKTYWNLRLLNRNTNTGNAAEGILCSHIPSKSFSYNSNQKFHFLGQDIGVSLGFATVDDLNNFCAEQYSAGTPVTIWYALTTPEPFYSPPAKLTMPTGYGQIIQVSGDVPDYPITARYLTHS